MTWWRNRIWFLVLACIGLTLSGFLTGTVRAEERCRTFEQTTQTVCGTFLTYWEQNGGLPVFGYPISAAQNAVDPETGKTFLTQWFERRRFELHPENAGTAYEVLGGLIGNDLRREALVGDPDFQRTVAKIDPAYPAAQQWYFSETGHNLRFAFQDYWIKNGGLARFGFPIDEAHAEVDPETGQTFVAQWFERARLNCSPKPHPNIASCSVCLAKNSTKALPVSACNGKSAKATKM